MYIKIFETEGMDLLSIVHNLKECGTMFGDFIFRISTLNTNEEFSAKDQFYKKLESYLKQEPDINNHYKSIEREIPTTLKQISLPDILFSLI